MVIAISNPSKQYTHQTVAALAGNPDYTVYFLTSFWFLPEKISWHRWLQKVPKIGAQLRKKSSDTVPPEAVVMHRTGILFSLFGRFLYKGEQRSFKEDQLHDAWVSKWIKKHQPAVFIGYEKSCINSFKEVKKYGGITILDLAQVHPAFIATLREKYSFFKEITGTQALFDKVCDTKKQEYVLADHILTLSGFARQTLIDNGIHNDKATTVNLGFEPKRFTGKAYTNDDERPLQLVFAGTVTRRKGVQLLLELMEGALAPYNIQLCIIGPVGDAFGFKERIATNERIVYYDYLQHDKMAALLRDSDAFVFPSYLDSWAMVVIEAMACGLPVIITDNTGSRDAVDEQCGFVIPTDDINTLLVKILYFYHNRQALEQMGKQARLRAEQYTWDNYYQGLRKTIEKIISSHA